MSDDEDLVSGKPQDGLNLRFGREQSSVHVSACHFCLTYIQEGESLPCRGQALRPGLLKPVEALRAIVPAEAISDADRRPALEQGPRQPGRFEDLETPTEAAAAAKYSLADWEKEPVKPTGAEAGSLWEAAALHKAAWEWQAALAEGKMPAELQNQAGQQQQEPQTPPSSETSVPGKNGMITS